MCPAEGVAPIAAQHEPRPELPVLQGAAEALLATTVDVVEPLSGGARRDTYRVIDHAGERYVMRLDHDAASLEKEVALTHLVAERVPVPRVVGADLAGELASVPLTLSVYVEGRSLDEALAAATDEESGALGDVVGRVLAEIGVFTFEEPGLLGPALRPRPLDVPLPELLVAMGERVLGESGARDALGTAIADGFEALLAEAAPALEPVSTQAALVHSDFNGKNLVMAREPDGSPSVAAVFDWEFAFAGPPLADLGNMLRRQERLPASFVDGFTSGFTAGGGELPPGWRAIAAALDALALLDFLDRGARGEHGPMFTEACMLIEEAVTRGDLAPPAPA
ncbi:MAG: phosphotransferase [Actinomycetota bacterium]|nr:phosphotransferase [Actinomycetota bacterium]MDH5223505.1 phosphotransferase [Actinomycetota bacterium]MDH5313356.1 phosphotransferase [Actinomycetota bacterium]